MQYSSGLPGDHALACRLAGQPVPQRPGNANREPANAVETVDRVDAGNTQFVDDQYAKDQPANAQPASVQPASVQPATGQIANVQPANTQPRASFDSINRIGISSHSRTGSKKRPAATGLVPIGKIKKAKVEDASVGDTPPIPTLQANLAAAAFNPGAPRAQQDASTQSLRQNNSTQISRNGLGENNVEQSEKQLDTVRHASCCSCLDMLPVDDMLILSCKGDADDETHPYCRNCLIRLFELSVRDSSRIPP